MTRRAGDAQDAERRKLENHLHMKLKMKVRGAAPAPVRWLVCVASRLTALGLELAVLSQPVPQLSHGTDSKERAMRMWCTLSVLFGLRIRLKAMTDALAKARCARPPWIATL